MPRMHATVREASSYTADEPRSAKHQKRLDTGLFGLSNEAAISTLLMQCPLMGEPAGAYIDCIWAQSCHCGRS